jgi:hypothetical protein
MVPLEPLDIGLSMSMQAIERMGGELPAEQSMTGPVMSRRSVPSVRCVAAVEGLPLKLPPGPLTPYSAEVNGVSAPCRVR